MENDNYSAEYAKALELSRVASGAYRIAAAAYRAGMIGDEEYLKARAIFEKANAAFDVAFEAEESRS